MRVATLIIFLIYLATTQAKAELGNIVRKGDVETEYLCLFANVGEVCNMDQYHADLYCRRQGTRLPTIKEFAQYAQGLGARGIRETAYPGVDWNEPNVLSEMNRMESEDFSPIDQISSAGENTIDFYYNKNEYRRPSGEFGNFIFWSSSLYDSPSSLEAEFAYAYYGDNGYINNYGRIYDEDFDASGMSIAVRCIRSNELNETALLQDPTNPDQPKK